jgi:hypothetical protein
MRRAALLLALALVPLACGDEPGPLDPPPTTEAGLRFGDGSTVWLRVHTGGGFVPEVIHLREVPSFLLFDDGRLVRAVPQDGLDLVPTFQEAQLDLESAGAVLDDARDVILGPDPGQPPITDVATTTIESLDGGIDIYALGFEEGLTADQRDARRAAEDLLADLAELGEGSPFVPEEWLALTIAPAAGLAPVDWPLEADRVADEAAPRVCTRLSPDEADQVLAAVGDAELVTVRAGDRVAELALVPVLTGNEDCTTYEGFVEH